MSINLAEEVQQQEVLVTLINTTGSHRPIYRNVPGGQDIRIDLRDVPKGVYMLLIETNTKQWTELVTIE